MIKEIILQDFFSFKGVNKVRLNDGLNLLLGINGSGKSTLLNAIRFLYEGVLGEGVEKLFQEKWGGFACVANANYEELPDTIKLTYVFDSRKLRQTSPKSPFNNDPCYEITIRRIGVSGYSLGERIYAADSRMAEQEYTYLSFRDGKGEITVYHHDGVKSEPAIFGPETSSQELILRQISDPLRYLPLHTLKSAITSMTIYSTFNTNGESRLRRPVEYNSSTRLLHDGNNLVQLLSNLKNTDSRCYARIEEALGVVNPNFLSFDFNVFGSQLYLSLKEKNLNHNIVLQHISDGTLRYILLCSILLNGKRGFLIGLDEPESRLHPDMINSVGKMLKEAAQQTQLLIATHSPLLLNSFCLEDTLVFEKDAENNTVVKRYAEADFEDYGGNMLPGQLWLRGEIGGKRW